jgi:hypothetical protein
MLRLKMSSGSTTSFERNVLDIRRSFTYPIPLFFVGCLSTPFSVEGTIQFTEFIQLRIQVRTKCHLVKQQANKT